MKIMVGGTAITTEFAEHVGADRYDPMAPGAVELAKRLAEKQVERKGYVEGIHTQF